MIVQSRLGPVKLRLRNCLHAPDAQVDLLSVGKFLRKGFQCIFRPGEFILLGPEGSSPRLECRGPIHGDLGFLSLTFTRPDDSSLVRELGPPISSSPHESSAFVRPPATRDLWHARLGLVLAGPVTRTGKRPQLDWTGPEKTGPSVAVALG